MKEMSTLKNISSEHPSQNFLTQVGLGHFFDARVGPGQPPLILENFQTFQFFSLQMKKISSSQRQVGPLFTTGQK